MQIIYRDALGIVTEKIKSVMFLDGLAYLEDKTIKIENIIQIAEV